LGKICENWCQILVFGFFRDGVTYRSDGTLKTIGMSQEFSAGLCPPLGLAAPPQPKNKKTEFDPGLPAKTKKPNLTPVFLPASSCQPAGWRGAPAAGLSR
jgi:hypothetical protein